MRRRSLLRLYPLRWRQRYEEEVGALVDDAPLSVSLVVDLLRGAFDAHAHPELGAPSFRGTFCDVRRRRERCSASLRGQAISETHSASSQKKG